MKTNVTKDITEIRDEVGKLKTDTINIIEQKQQETRTRIVSETQKLQKQFDKFKRNQGTNQGLDREVTILGNDDSSLPQTVQHPDHIPKQYISEELHSYLKESYEDETVLNNTE